MKVSFLSLKNKVAEIGKCQIDKFESTDNDKLSELFTKKNDEHKSLFLYKNKLETKILTI